MSHYNAVLARNADNVVKDPLSSHTAAFSHYNNLSAQLPVDISTGRLVAGDAAAQAAQCLKNIQAILSSIDHVLNDVVRLTVHLTSAKDLDAVAGVCRAWFPVRAPC
ncbi:TPA: RidA family protein [Pluralibacter gergoviae]